MSYSELSAQFFNYIILCGFAAILAYGCWYLQARFVVSRMPSPPLSMGQPLWRKLLLGLVIGVLAMWLMLWPPFFSGAFTETAAGYTTFADVSKATPPDFPAQPIGQLDFSFLLRFFSFQALFEELAFRGIGFCLLATALFSASANYMRPRDAGPRWMYLNWLACGLISNVLVSAAFVLLHAGNPEVSTLALINIGLASLMLGQLFWNQASIAGAAVVHIVWNLALALFGLPVSGIVVSQPLLGSAQGAGLELLSGGSFGPEASMSCSAALLILFAYLLWQAMPGKAQDGEPAASPAGE